MELIDILHSNAAYREFTSEPVDDKVLYEILDVARFAPSGGNRQGWQVVIAKDPKLRLLIQEQYQIAWREYMAHVRAGLVPFAPISDGRWEGPAIDLAEAHRTPAPSSFVDNLESAPALVLLFVNLADLAVLDNGLDRQSIVGGASIYPFGYNILLAARSKGLGGVMTTALCRYEDPILKACDAQEGFALAGLIVLGYPTKVITKLKRDPVESFTHIDSLVGDELRSNP